MFFTQEYSPHPNLKRYIKTYWTLKSPAITGELKKKQLLPDSGIKISFNLADPVEFILKGNERFQVPDGCVSGALTTNFWIVSKGNIDRFGLQFHPGGIYPFIDFPSIQLTNNIFSITRLWGESASQLTKQLVSTDKTVEERIRILDRFLLEQLSGNTSIDPVFEEAVSTIINAKGNIIIDEVSKAIHLSNRQLERKFKEKIGITPKLLCRILRFRRVFEHLTDFSDDSWVSTALTCGYYDQSHFIHDFKTFTGLSPSKFVETIIKKNLFINWYPNIEAALKMASQTDE